MLHIHTSNRLETLAHKLADLIREDPLPPLVTETVVTQSTGMGRWLSLALAGELGVAANIHFPFPAKFAEDELSRLLPHDSASPIYRREVLPWRIHTVIRPLLEEPQFSTLRAYTGDDAEKLWQLCQQLAVTFDRYIAHRPQMLRAWDAGHIESGEEWQARLWLALGEGASHPAALIERAHRGTGVPPVRPLGVSPDAARGTHASPTAGTAMPHRCAIFGLSALAPTYLDFLALLSQRRDVHLFLLAPTEHYWGDLQSEREKVRFIAWCQRNGKIAGAEHIDEGHPLLASFGKVGRDFHDALIDLPTGGEHDYFQPIDDETLLARLQNDILELRAHAEDRTLSPSDQSLRLHACHSPVRELEVLHDQLLAMFAADSTLTPRDILVAVPNIEDYAPFIEGVFGAPESDAVRFPYSIADREARTESSVTDAFLRVLELADSRFPATAVLALLDCPAVHTKFGFSEADLPLIRQWIIGSGIRWGRDAAQRAELHLPASNEHTWQFGMDRLILGFALPGDGSRLFAGVLPEPAVEGSLAEALGRFASFTHTLFTQADAFQEPRTAAQWSTTLRDTLLALFESDHDFADSWRNVAHPLASIAENAAHAGHTHTLPFSVIRQHARELLGATQRESAFLRGGITFCSLRPMRAIPHRVICLLGMNDGAFPRQDRAPAFDLTASHPRPGDRSTRDDDRYLFLEAILSARDRLLISWCGQSAQDNSQLPPSVVVAELLDTLTRSYELTPEQLITRHRLQPFSPHYFGSGPLFSYSSENARGAAFTQLRENTTPFASTLTAPEIAKHITLERLADALTRPAQFFARERLGIALPYDEPQPADIEPLETSGLDEYTLSTHLTDAHFKGTVPETLLTATAATGMLPHGYAGESFFHDTAISVRQLTDLAPGPALEPVPVSVHLGEWQISGSLRIVTPAGLLSLRPATVKGRDFLRAWIGHIVLCAAQPPGVPQRSILIGEKASFEYHSIPAPEALAYLETLLSIYERLHANAVPLFPESSLAFADYELNPGSRKKAPQTAAEERWLGGGYGPARGERDDHWNALVWRDTDPLGEAFAQLARDVFGPLLKHRTPL